MKTVIIESPYAGDVQTHVDYARACLLDSLGRGEAPFASHLLYTQVLDDSDPVERSVGIMAGFGWAVHAQLTAVYTDLGISAGMEAGIEHARRRGRRVEYRKLPRWGRQDEPLVIAMVGLKGAGKDTAARIIRDCAEREGLSTAHIAFADALREVARVAFGLADQQMTDRDLKEQVLAEWGMSPRRILQLLGTEVGRAIHPDVWVRACMRSVTACGADVITITDCRFDNEVEAVRRAGGHTIFIDRPGLSTDDPHPSEAMAARWAHMAPTDVWRLWNHGDLAELETEARRMWGAISRSARFEGRLG